MVAEITFLYTHTFGFCLGNPLDDWEKETDLQTTLSKEMGNSIFLSYFGEDGRCFNAEKDIVIPPAVNMGKAIINLNNFRKTRLAQHKKEKGTKSRRQLVLMAGKTQLEKDTQQPGCARKAQARGAERAHSVCNEARRRAERTRLRPAPFGLLSIPGNVRQRARDANPAQS